MIKPWTFDTAPISVKVREIANDKRHILALVEDGFVSLMRPGKISFQDALRDYVSA